MPRKLNFLDNLIHTPRYTPNFLICKESVADHVWCMNALAIEYVDLLNSKFKTSYSLPNVIYGIALHDIDESLSCDIPRNFKYHDKELRGAIQNTVESLLAENLPKNPLKDYHYFEDKTNVYGCIIKIFDIAQAGYKMISEIKLGNSYFRSEIENTFETFGGMRDIINQSDFQDNYKEGLRWLINEFINEFNEQLKEL